MDTITFDSVDPVREVESLARAPYAGCLSMVVLGHAIVCAMPQFIELDEITRPLWPASVFESTWFDAPDEGESLDFEPPLLAAGRFTTVARRGTLPLPDWD